MVKKFIRKTGRYKRKSKGHKKVFRKRFKKYGRKKYTQPFSGFRGLKRHKLFIRIPVKGYDILGDTAGQISRYGHFKINSVAAPLGDLTKQPQYYDQIKYIYDKFKVTGCKYKLKFWINSNAYPAADIPDKDHPRGLIVNVGCEPNGISTLPGAGTSMTADAALKMGSNPGIQQRVVQHDRTKPCYATFKGYKNFRSIVGKNQFLNTDYEAAYDSDPSRPIYLSWTVTKQDNDILDPVVFYLTGWFKFYVECTRKSIDQFDVAPSG